MTYIQYSEIAPNVHTHIMQEDQTADAQGYSEVEICCHACGLYEIIRFTLLKKDDPILKAIGNEGFPKLTKIRDVFIDKHKTCITALNKPPFIGDLMPELRGNDQYKMLCPPWRKFTVPEKMHDLRGQSLL